MRCSFRRRVPASSRATTSAPTRTPASGSWSGRPPSVTPAQAISRRRLLLLLLVDLKSERVLADDLEVAAAAGARDDFAERQLGLVDGFIAGRAGGHLSSIFVAAYIFGVRIDGPHRADLGGGPYAAAGEHRAGGLGRGQAAVAQARRREPHRVAQGPWRGGPNRGLPGARPAGGGDLFIRQRGAGRGDLWTARRGPRGRTAVTAHRGWTRG